MHSYKEQFADFKKRNPQIISYRKRRWLLLAMKILLLDGAILLVGAVCGNRYGVMFQLGIGAAIILPLWLFQPWRCFGKRLIGEISEIRYENRCETISKNPADTRYTNRQTVTYILCRVKTERDDRTVLRLNAKYDAAYQVGDTVLTVSGLDYPINLTPHDLIVCPRCGTVMPKENERCVAVGCRLPAPIIPLKSNGSSNGGEVI